MHRGLPIGERERKNYDRNIMKTLRQQIQEKFNFRKKLDELSKSSNLNDFLAYKEYLDGVEKQIVSLKIHKCLLNAPKNLRPTQN